MYRIAILSELPRIIKLWHDSYKIKNQQQNDKQKSNEVESKSDNESDITHK
jgi:hypothetical protein